jgi:hypothetical protein
MGHHRDAVVDFSSPDDLTAWLATHNCSSKRAARPAFSQASPACSGCNWRLTLA